MGEVTLEMPVGHFRMPFKGGTEYAGFSWLQENGIENTFFCERIDVTIDDTLKLVYVKATEHAQCKSCSRKRYVLNLLKPCDGEVVVQRTSFPFNSGEVHIFTSAPTIQITEATGLYYGSYQAVYFLYGIGNGPAIKLQHGITAQQYFCTKQFESSEFPDFSILLYKILHSVKCEPGKN
jgi:hypothetical protein